eukprot:4712218-Amphidinium_carterae.1
MELIVTQALVPDPTLVSQAYGDNSADSDLVIPVSPVGSYQARTSTAGPAGAATALTRSDQ